MSRLADDWQTNGRDKLKRIAVVVQPLPDGSEKTGAMLARVARRYVHMKRNFLVKADSAKAAAVDRTAECADAMDGILWLQPDAKAQGSDGVELNVKASL